MMCIAIIDKWLLPAFKQKLTLTLTKRREPNWFKEFLDEWKQINNLRVDKESSYTDITKWVCSCKQFKISCYYLCRHLLVRIEEAPKFRTQLTIQDVYPFISFQKKSTTLDESVQKDSVVLFSKSFQNESVTTPNELLSGVNEHDESASYVEIVKLIDFLKKEADQHKYNIKQLKVMEKVLKPAFNYMKDIDLLEKSQEIPRTWKDLNENTLYY
jgi:hypothetical protein